MLSLYHKDYFYAFYFFYFFFPKLSALVANLEQKKMDDVRARCTSIKSKKHPDQRCLNKPKEGTLWCSCHSKSQVLYEPKESVSCSNAAPIETQSMSITIKANGRRKIRPQPLTRSPRVYLKIHREQSATLLQHFWFRYGRPVLRRDLGQATFLPELAHNDKEISTYDSVTFIPLCYRFSYIDEKHHLWIFDTRFLMSLLQYGNNLKNPFTQELIDTKTVERLQKRSEQLHAMKKPILYQEEDSLTPEQIWNQKVLDVFLKLTSLGYGVNVLWFETLTLRGHEIFYTKLYSLWNIQLGLTTEEKERIVPGHDSGRVSLFRWHPSDVVGRGFELKWWRKQNLNLMRAFLQRSDNKEIQGCGALYILTALANTHRHCAESFPWLVQDD